jgi:hypothetical protein
MVLRRTTLMMIFGEELDTTLDKATSVTQICYKIRQVHCHKNSIRSQAVW